MKKLNLTIISILITLLSQAQGLVDRGDNVYVDLANIGDESVEGFYMVLVKNGYFKMGATHEQLNPDKDEMPTHMVFISKDFYIGETEVTQNLWEYVMGENPSKIKDSSSNLPVDNITWEDAQTFCKNLSRLTKRKFRLPTEAEWEYAARGGHKAEEQTIYSGSNDLNEVGWYDGNSNYRSHPVKTKKPNALGLYDMSGNVYEICQDSKEKYDKDGKEETDPMVNSGNDTPKIRRGGAWSEPSKSERVSFRRKMDFDKGKNAHEANSNTGMRLVMEID